VMEEMAATKSMKCTTGMDLMEELEIRASNAKIRTLTFKSCQCCVWWCKKWHGGFSKEENGV
jgi:hypothetical protein